MVRKLFQEQQGGQRKSSLATVKQTIERVAGGSGGVVPFLEALCSSRFWRQYMGTSHLRVSNSTEKLKQIVGVVKRQWDLAGTSKKRQWSSMVCKSLTREELALLGWQISSKVRSQISVVL
jgi:hypothetical protein